MPEEFYPVDLTPELESQVASLIIHLWDNHGTIMGISWENFISKKLWKDPAFYSWVNQ
jgi:hypothetical protein